MKKYVFTKGIFNFLDEYEERPAPQAGTYTDRKEAFADLMELNKPRFKDWKIENNYTKSIKQFCKDYCIDNEPLAECYSMYEIEVEE